MPAKKPAKKAAQRKPKDSSNTTPRDSVSTVVERRPRGGAKYGVPTVSTPRAATARSNAGTMTWREEGFQYGRQRGARPSTRTTVSPVSQASQRTANQMRRNRDARTLNQDWDVEPQQTNRKTRATSRAAAQQAMRAARAGVQARPNPNRTSTPSRTNIARNVSSARGNARSGATARQRMGGIPGLKGR